MKNWPTLILTLFILSCQRTIPPKKEQWWINSSKVPCTGVGQMSCLQIQKGKEIQPDQWLLFYDEIEGFDYEPGNIYHVRIEVSEKTGQLPADASALSYKLDEVLSKSPDMLLRLTNLWKIVQVAEFRNPTDFKNKEPLVFEFNWGERFYSGNMGCNSVRGNIEKADMENILLERGMSTLMACPDMRVEEAVRNALEKTRKYRIEDHHLYLLDSMDSQLVQFQVVD